MNFADHSDLVGQHAFLSASKYSWIRYDDDKLRESYFNRMEAAKGSRLHEIAKELIQMRIKLPKNGLTLSQYVNDAIGFNMIPEQVLFVSRNCFGTADAIKFDLKKMVLRIHDLKNGVSVAKMDQLMIYTAMFCIEYGYKPHELTIILRIYQHDTYEEYSPMVEQIVVIMDKIITFDRYIEEMRAEALGE
jgi:hypothetical protein